MAAVLLEEASVAFHLRGLGTDRLVRELAAKEGLGLGDAVKLALCAKLEAKTREPS